jgi:hypothetical protein
MHFNKLDKNETFIIQDKVLQEQRHVKAKPFVSLLYIPTSRLPVLRMILTDHQAI